MHPFLCIGFKLWVSSAYEVNWTAHLYEIQVTHPRIGAISHFISALKKKSLGETTKRWKDCCEIASDETKARLPEWDITMKIYLLASLKAVTLSVFLSLSADQQLLSLFLSHHSPPPTSLNNTEKWTLECYPVGSTPPKSTCSLNRREVWLNPDHRCPRTPNTHTTTSSLMAKQQYKNLKTHSSNRNVRDFSRIQPFCKCIMFIRQAFCTDVSPVGASHIPANITYKGSPSE